VCCAFTSAPSSSSDCCASRPLRRERLYDRLLRVLHRRRSDLPPGPSSSSAMPPAKPLHYWELQGMVYVYVEYVRLHPQPLRTSGLREQCPLPLHPFPILAIFLLIVLVCFPGWRSCMRRLRSCRYLPDELPLVGSVEGENLGAPGNIIIPNSF